MDTLKVKRKGFRISFTACIKKVEQELLKTEPALNELLILQAQLKDKFERLSACQDEISDCILQAKDSEDAFAEDLLAAEEYRDKYYAVLATVESKLCHSASSKDLSEKRKYKLPKIELKRFNGEAKDFLAFWSQFEKIHLDETLPDEDKFQYLLQSVVPKSKAARLVESFPATASNYPKAVQQLKERFGREDLLVQIYVRELLSMVMKNAVSGRTKTELPVLYDELEGKLRALESLGKTQEKYGDFLTPLVESCLPEDILVAWERSRKSTDSSPSDDRSLENLMGFLKQEVMGEEMVVLARNGFGASQNKRSKESSNEHAHEISTAAALINTNGQENSGRRHFNCLFCDKKHPSQDCYMARKLNIEEKRKLLIKKGACFSCLRLGHTSRVCKFKNKCIQCNKNHFILMCPDREMRTNENKAEVGTANVLTDSCTIESVLLMTLVVKIRNMNHDMKIRALVDTGSQLSYLSNRVINKLKLKPKQKQNLVHSLFGGRKSKPCVHEVYEISIVDLQNTFSVSVDVLSEDKICGFVPKAKSVLTLNELKESKVVITDLDFPDHEIDLLLGANVAGLIMTGNSFTLNSGLVVLETKLGHTLMGKERMCDKYEALSETKDIASNLCDSVSVVTLTSMMNDVNNLWDLDAIGITDPWENAKKVNLSDAVELLQDSLTILPDGRYELLLPFKHEVQLPSNKDLTIKRHKNMCRRAAKGNYLKDYIDVFKEWERLKIIERVPDGELNNDGYYLPHRPVIKETSQTSKIRPVFDASAKEGNGPSLNDCLIKGMNLIELIPDIIDRFRLYKIGLTADIEKAFLQLSIAPEHRDFLRFIFPSETEEFVVYRHCRVVFGVNTSPFLLMASLHHLFENAAEDYCDLIPKLRNSFYVDNCVTGVSNLEELNRFVTLAQTLMQSACFNLRSWEGNISSPCLYNSTGDTSLLGIVWNLDRDTIRCNIPSKISSNQALTKRVVLSIVQQIFDPLGILCPATLIPKLLLQDTWKSKISWDNLLPNQFQKEFSNWLKEVAVFDELRIPRYLRTNKNSELHVFVDACKKSYGACAFLRSADSQEITIQLVRAKARVAPMKEMSIPKLELMACCIGTRLAHSIKLAFDLPEMNIRFWSDSMTALWWIRECGEWSIFVSNRIKEIRKLTSPENWRHVPGDKNPADIVSRGCTPQQLIKSQWWKGPQWLYLNEDGWPSNKIFCEKEVERERRKVSLCHFNVEEKEMPWYAMKFSNFESIIHLVSWILRFINNIRKESGSRNFGRLTLTEKENAENFLIRQVQSSFFVTSHIPVYNTFLDEDGIIRVKTRITERIDKPLFLSPVLLPPKCIFTQRLIEHYHRMSCHSGTQILLSILREKFWIVNGRRTVRNIVNNCIICKRFKTKSLISDPVPLPVDRVKDATIFEVIGVDLAGPLYIKHGDKTWVVLFTCAIYRAVHLELVTSLSTDTFLLAFRRFVARRGRPRVVYSDNGTNFKGAYNSLNEIDWNKIVNEAELYRISWRFNPPTAAWWGGWWERLVRTLKELLKRTLGKAVLTFEELQTILCDCECVMNSRPLTYMSEDSEDLRPLTPAMFLIENTESKVSDIDQIDAEHCHKRIRYRMKLLDELRRRFRQEYLSQLILRQNQKNQHPSVKVGEIVLIGDDCKKRLDWPLAKIIQLIPGKDDKVRTVKLKTKNGVLTRPIQRVFPLELQSNDYLDSFSQIAKETIPLTVPRKQTVPKIENPPMIEKVTKVVQPSTDLPRVTRTGRVVKNPQKLDLLNMTGVLSHSESTQKGEGCWEILSNEGDNNKAVMRCPKPYINY